jgi:putative DNA primase/helicase
VLSRLDGVRRSGSRWAAFCPAHEDRHRSLSIGEGRDGGALLTCHAGCTVEAIVVALGFTVADLFPPGARTRHNRQRPRRDPDKLTPYAIRDLAGVIQALHERRDRSDGSKDFVWRRPDGQVGLGGRPGASLPFYRSETLASANSNRQVMIVEGEKAADALALLVAPMPVVATVTGAASIPDTSVVATLRGYSVVLWPDNDEPGRAHMRRLAEALLPVAAEVRILHVPGLLRGGDAADFVAAGGSAEEVLDLIRSSARYTPETTMQADPEAGKRRLERPTPVTVRLSDVTAAPVSWLWQFRIPRAKVAILEGDPGLGKSTIALDVAARVTTGAAMPDGNPGGDPATVVILSAEDGLADTILPRLQAAGADLQRVVSLQAVVGPHGERDLSIPGDLDALEVAVLAEGARLVVVDPLMAYLGGGVNSWRDQDVRRALAPLAAMANRTGAAVLVIRHLNKGRAGSPLYRGGGSIGITGAARTVLLVAPDPEDGDRRIVAVSKCNLAPLAPALAYRIAPTLVGDIGTSRIAWEGPTGHTAAGLLAVQHEDDGGGHRSAQVEAMEVLREILANGPVAATDARREAHGAGVADRTLDRARRALSIVARKVGQPGQAGQRWEWVLPPKDANLATTAQPAERETSEERHASVYGALGVLQDPGRTARVIASDHDGSRLAVWRQYGPGAYLDEDGRDLPA